jgi:hypothetical protein
MPMSRIKSALIENIKREFGSLTMFFWVVVLAFTAAIFVMTPISLSAMRKTLSSTSGRHGTWEEIRFWAPLALS